MESDAALTPYELRVKRNIEENQRVLKSLGLLNTSFKSSDVKKTGKKTNVAAVRRESVKPDSDSTFSPLLPARRTRRSSSFLKSQGLDEFDEVPVDFDEEYRPPQKKKKIAPECVFGPIEGVSVGDWWQTRIECSAAGVHRPTVAGIHGKTGEGCYSIALSGGYEDDIDCGEYFTYTGSGGRDLKGTKSNPKNLRTAPQTKDQVLEGANAHLALNVENHRLVRVIRGYKLPSPFAPEEGYRYDGLYSVERCWTATGLAGFKVYKYALKRITDQDPPPWVVNGLSDPVGNKAENPIDNGLLEGKEDENISKRQDSLSDSVEVSKQFLKPLSMELPNSNESTENNVSETMLVCETPNKRKRRSSDVEIKSELISYSPNTNRGIGIKLSVPETEAIHNLNPTKKRKRRSSDIENESELCKQKSNSTVTLNFAQKVLKSNNSIIEKDQMSKKIYFKDSKDKQSQVEKKRRLSNNENVRLDAPDETMVSYTNECSPDSCQTKLLHQNGNNTDVVIKSNQRLCENSPNAVKKTVTFSPEVLFKCDRSFTYEPLFCVNCENKCCICKPAYSPESSTICLQPPLVKSSSDVKKQTSILKYFGPMNGSSDKISTSRGILLRGNRRSFGVFSHTFNSAPSKESISPKPSQLPQCKTNNSKIESKSKVSQVNIVSSSPDNSDISNLKQDFPSASNSLGTSSVKEERCSHFLLSVEIENVTGNTFTGWDPSEEDKFLGFDFDEETQNLFHGFDENDENSINLLKIKSVIQLNSKAFLEKLLSSSIDN